MRVTPKQIAANAILAMSSVELTEAIAAELDENPALEMLEQSACPICGSTITGSHCTECLPKEAAGSAPEAVDGGVGEWSLRDESDDLDPIARAEAEFTLQEHLDWTLRALLPARLHVVTEYAIGALDDSGFLTESDEAIAAATGHTAEDVAAVREALRGVEPIGVGSRNVAEMPARPDRLPRGDRARWRSRRSQRTSCGTTWPTSASGASRSSRRRLARPRRR